MWREGARESLLPETILYRFVYTRTYTRGDVHMWIHSHECIPAYRFAECGSHVNDRNFKFFSPVLIFLKARFPTDCHNQYLHSDLQNARSQTIL